LNCLANTPLCAMRARVTIPRWPIGSSRRRLHFIVEQWADHRRLGAQTRAAASLLAHALSRCSVLVELRRQSAREMVEHQPDTSRGPGLSMHDQPHFPFELECLFEHSDELGLPPS
jgi:hypothetical protein